MEEGFDGSFADYNLYDTITVLAKFLLLLHSQVTAVVFAPLWHLVLRLPLTVCYQNAGAVKAANTDNEPYSEYYAYQVAKVMGIDAIPYGLSK